jgi:DNA processing protein
MSTQHEHPTSGNLDGIRAARATLAHLTASWATHTQLVFDLVERVGPSEALNLLVSGQTGHDLLNRAGLCGEQLRDLAEDAVARATRGGMRILIPEDTQRWSQRLTDLGRFSQQGRSFGPLCLWARGDGNLRDLTERSVALVGSRAATDYGTWVAQDLAQSLVLRELTVVSTPAYGVEAAALGGLVSAGGRGVAVTPSGLDRPHPHANRGLLSEVARRGLVITAQPPGTFASHNSMIQNRVLVACLAQGVVLVEASPRSSSLELLRRAMSMGRAGMVIPGPVTSLMSTGGHNLLRTDSRARLVTCCTDICDELTRKHPEPKT